MPNSRAGVRRPPPWLWHEGLVLSYSIHKDGLIINAVVVIVRHPADLQGEATERQHRKAAAESKVTPEAPPMNIHVYVAMHHNVVAELDGMLRLRAHLDRALNDMSIGVADA